MDSDDKLRHEWVDRPPLRQNNHNSDTDKMTATKNSLTSTKLSECLVLLATLHKIKCLQYEPSYYRSPSFGDVKPLYRSPKPGHIPASWQQYINNIVRVGNIKESFVTHYTHMCISFADKTVLTYFCTNT